LHLLLNFLERKSRRFNVFSNARLQIAKFNAVERTIIRNARL